MSLAAGIWVKSLTGSSSLAALVSVCIYAPSALSPLAGLLADRVPRKPLLITVNAVTAAAMLPMLAVRSEDQVWLILVAMTCYGAALALIDPAEQALFVVMLPHRGATADQRPSDESPGGRQAGRPARRRRTVLTVRWRSRRRSRSWWPRWRSPGYPSPSHPYPPVPADGSATSAPASATSGESRACASSRSAPRRRCSSPAP